LAGEACDRWLSRFSKKELPDKIDEIELICTDPQCLVTSILRDSGLTASASTTSYLSVFNGCPDQVSSNYGYRNQTIITATSSYSNGGGNIIAATVRLSSAGFITFLSAATDAGVSTVDRFAIPIFTY
jgi:hypothetical protein